MLEKLGVKSRWDIVPAVLSVLLYLNFIVFVILLFAATGVLLLYVVVGEVAAIGLGGYISHMQVYKRLYLRLL